jgi:flagellar biogenesis protein FliO
MRTSLLCLGLLVFSGLALPAQALPPSPSQAELSKPMDKDDVKPTPGQPSPSGPSGWQAFGSTLLVIGLAGGGLWAFRKYGMKKLPGRGGERLKVEETLALGDRRFISILRAEEERFLIALTPQGITLLARMDGVETAPTGTFQEALEHHVEVTRPTSVREVEAMMKGERP